MSEGNAPEAGNFPLFREHSLLSCFFEPFTVCATASRRPQTVRPSGQHLHSTRSCPAGGLHLRTMNGRNLQGSWSGNSGRGGKYRRRRAVWSIAPEERPSGRTENPPSGARHRRIPVLPCCIPPEMNEKTPGRAAMPGVLH